MSQGFRFENIRVALVLAVIAGAAVVVHKATKVEEPEVPGVTLPRTSSGSARRRPPARRQEFGKFSLWWDGIPDHFHKNRVDTGDRSNIYASDYAGAESCKKCHQKNYESWSNHPHRWMNALAGDSTVKGDFSGDSSISYMGGEATFYRDGPKYLMELVRDDVRHVCEITQTIGSRFYQYYVGVQVEGPEPEDHPRFAEGHVLPFGYWLDREEWVPIVHVHDREDRQDWEVEKLHDPFQVHESPEWTDWNAYCDESRDLYRAQCNFCHTTFPVGDMMVRSQKRMGLHAPVTLHLSLPDYVAKATPYLWDTSRKPWDLSDEEFAPILREYHNFDAEQKAVSLGVGCEACHLGAKEHAEDKTVMPAFFPTSPDLVIQTASGDMNLGRSHDNVNWACGRCHAGERPQFANGVSTWNSTEFSDASRGSCYSKLTCIECHNPHETIGPEWSRTPAQDDTSCLKCHEKFEPTEARMAHTHHPVDSPGSRCMNCHMPRINEGMQDVVRTHTIFSPTDHRMIEANHPNACNVCHVDRPIDWTIGHLKNWYGASFDDRKVASNYPDREAPVAISWLKSKTRFVRQVAADALARAESGWAMPELIKALDDPFLLNRQFARIGLEKMQDVKLSDFGYQFYMTEDERQEPLKRIRKALLSGDNSAQPDGT